MIAILPFPCDAAAAPTTLPKQTPGHWPERTGRIHSIQRVNDKWQ